MLNLNEIKKQADELMEQIKEVNNELLNKPYFSGAEGLSELASTEEVEEFEAYDYKISELEREYLNTKKLVNMVEGLAKDWNNQKEVNNQLLN